MILYFLQKFFTLDLKYKFNFNSMEKLQTIISVLFSNKLDKLTSYYKKIIIIIKSNLFEHPVCAPVHMLSSRHAFVTNDIFTGALVKLYIFLFLFVMSFKFLILEIIYIGKMQR